MRPDDRDHHGRPLTGRPAAQGQRSIAPGQVPPSAYPQQPTQYPQPSLQPQQPKHYDPSQYPQQLQYYAPSQYPQQPQYPPSQYPHPQGYLQPQASWQPPAMAPAGTSAVPLLVAIGFAAVGAFVLVGAARTPHATKKALDPIATPVASVTATAPPRPAALKTDAAAAVVAAIDAGPLATAKPKRPRNVLLLTIDTLRADLGFTGYPRPVSAHLDGLAKTSAVFEHAYSMASYTPKSMGPMMIGRYGSETARNGEHYTKFAASNLFVAERAHDAGLRTFGGVCHRYFMWNMGFEQGMDIYDMSAAPPNPTDDDPRLTSDKLTDVAIKILSKPENSGGRFYGWFHYVDPHTPYAPHPDAPDFAHMPPEHMPSQRALYDAEVWYTDREVGRLLDFVAAQPWGKDTAIIVTADHGESFGEHDHWRHGREVWESLVRVPLIVHLPDGEGKRITIKRSQIDLVPTIMDLLGLPPDPTLHGTSLLADIDAPPDAKLPERDLFVDMMKGPYNEERRAVITGTSPGIKLIDFEGHRTEVYDLASDPLEGKPLKKADPRFVEATEAYDRMKRSLVPGKLVP